VQIAEPVGVEPEDERAHDDKHRTNRPRSTSAPASDLSGRRS
jgi:hypothetical protein